MPQTNAIENLPKLSDEVSHYYSGWLRVNEYYRLLLDSNIENWRMYWAKNPQKGYGQWPLSSVATAVQQGRALLQFNFIRPTVDSIAAQILQQGIDPEFSIVNGETDSLVGAIKTALYSDKELCNWKMALYDLVIQGLINFGCISLRICDKFNELGNIGIYSELPGSVLPDPYWKSLVSSECKRADKECWYTAAEIAELYPKFKDRLTAEIQRERQSGNQYGTDLGITPYKQFDNKWGSLHRLIEHYEMVEIKKEKEYTFSPSLGEVEIPDDLSEKPDDTDPTTKPGWLNVNAPDWRPDMIWTKPSSEKVCYIKTCCPGLINDVLLEDKPIEVQIGCLPFKWWAAARSNGEFSSIVDLVKDMQIDINYVESLMRHKMQVEGGGGSQFVDKSKFDKNEDYLNYTRYRGHPQKIFNVKPGTLDRGTLPAVPTAKSQYDPAMINHVRHITQELWPNVSKTTPATLGQTEQGNQTSGRLYELLKTQGDRLTYTINYNWRLFNNDMFESVFMLAVQLYSNERVPREFSYGKEKTVLNEHVTVNGLEAIRNDVAMLKGVRVKVIISDKQESPTEKMNNIGILSEYTKTLGPNNILTSTLVNAQIAKNIDQFDDETKELIKEAAMKEYEVAESNLALMLLNNQVQMKALEAQLNPPPPSSPLSLPNGGALPTQSGEPNPEMIPPAPQEPINNPMPPVPQEPPAQGVTI